MSQLGSSLAIQSWCFREALDHPSVIRWLKACGLRNLEICPKHVNPITATDYTDMLATYAKEGCRLTCYGVHKFDGNEANARKVFEFAKLCGMPMISCDLVEGGEQVCEKLCAEYGIKVGIHNHGRTYRLGHPWGLAETFARTSPNIGLCLDTAWMLDSGHDPIKVAERFRDRLYGVHVKDFIFTREGRPEDVVVGLGNLRLDDLMKFLVSTNWSGLFTLEYEGDRFDPVPALTKCVQAIQTSLAKAGAK